jgi:hypothetical protein
VEGREGLDRTLESMLGWSPQMKGETMPKVQARMSKDAKCHYCGRKLTTQTGRTWDHIVPTSRGGLNNGFNRVTSCFDCNQLKDDLMSDCPCTKCEQARTLCWLDGLPSLGFEVIDYQAMWTRKYQNKPKKRLTRA